MKQLKGWASYFFAKLEKIIPGQSYFPSGRYKSFHDLDPPEVARMIEDYCDEYYADFSERALVEFMYFTPEIAWMKRVAKKLSQITFDFDPLDPGASLTHPAGKMRALRIAEELRKQACD